MLRLKIGTMGSKDSRWKGLPPSSRSWEPSGRGSCGERQAPPPAWRATRGEAVHHPCALVFSSQPGGPLGGGGGWALLSNLASPVSLQCAPENTLPTPMVLQR